MFLFNEGLLPQNVLFLFIFFYTMKLSYRFMANITPNVNNSFVLGILNILIPFLEI